MRGLEELVREYEGVLGKSEEGKVEGEKKMQGLEEKLGML